MKKITFTKPAAPYNAGDVATFDDASADRFVQLGLATHVDEGKKATRARDDADEAPAKRVPRRQRGVDAAEVADRDDYVTKDY